MKLIQISGTWICIPLHYMYDVHLLKKEKPDKTRVTK